MLDPAYRQQAHAALLAYNDSPMQQRLRQERPLWAGVVYWNPQEVDRDELITELRRIRDLGFGFVRFHAFDPVERGEGDYDFTYTDLRFEACAEVGLTIFPHLSLRTPSPAVLKRQGLSLAQADRLPLSDPRVHEAVYSRMQAIIGRYRSHPAMANGGAWPLQGEPHATGIALVDEHDQERFRQWLQERYADPAAVHAAWCIYPRVREASFCEEGRRMMRIASWQDAVELAAGIRLEVDGRALAITGLKHEIYGATRDLVRFRADAMLADCREHCAMIRCLDPDHPILVGTHQLFYNNPQLGWDNHGIGRVADCHFSSIHLSWHFEGCHGEVDRPLYMQARLTNDAFKGGCTSAYETTGGAVQYSGGYGNHMDEGLMRRMMVAYLAAGNESIAFWSWNARPGGIEAGEYGLTTYSGAVSPWATAAGAVVAGMKRHLDEIWTAVSEPEVAILRSWDTEMVTSLEPRRFDLEDGPSAWSRGPGQQHLRALIGAQRVAIDHQLCYQVVDEAEILAGVAGLYPSLYLPHVRGLSDAVLERLLEYVEHGGRLIADVQIAFEDQWAKCRRPGPGGLVERIFGAWIDMIHDARTRQQQVDAVPITGFYGDLVTTRARVIKRFANQCPAVSCCRTGQGEAILIAFDPAHMCFSSQSSPVAPLLADLLRGQRQSSWTCDLPMTWRRTTPVADHYFFINDHSAPCLANLRIFDRPARRAHLVIEDQAIPVEAPIAVPVPAGSAVWLRVETA